MSNQGSSSRLRVGIVGASPTRGWALSAHLPALAQLPELELVAVATTREETARAAAEAHGARLAFAHGPELAAHPDVDVVVVSVKVPDHAAVVRAAVAAGKQVFCEWPLGVDLAEATELAELAQAAGVVTLIGLQGMHAPGARFVHDLIAEGRIGQVLSAGVVASSGLGGARVPEGMVWSTDKAAGVTALTITGGHVLGTLSEMVGGLQDVAAAVGSSIVQATVVETGQPVPVSSPGQLALVGRLTGGAVASVTIQGAAPPGAGGFYLRIVGTEGALTITPAEPGGNIHINRWTVELAGPQGPAERIEVPERYRVVPAGVPAGPPENVAALYRELAQAVAQGRSAFPSFATAVAFQDLLERADQSSTSGARQAVA